MEHCVALKLFKRIRLDQSTRKVHLDIPAVGQAVGALNNWIQRVEIGGGHVTGCCDLDLCSVKVDSNNYRELLAGQYAAFHPFAATLQPPQRRQQM